MSIRTRARKVTPAMEEPITPQKVVAWGKLAWPIVTLIASLIIGSFVFGGNTKAAEMKIVEDMSALKDSAFSLKAAMDLARGNFERLNETIGRIDERLKGVDKRLELIERGK